MQVACRCKMVNCCASGWLWGAAAELLDIHNGTACSSLYPGDNVKRREVHAKGIGDVSLIKRVLSRAVEGCMLLRIIYPVFVPNSAGLSTGILACQPQTNAPVGQLAPELGHPILLNNQPNILGSRFWDFKLPSHKACRQ